MSCHKEKIYLLIKGREWKGMGRMDIAFICAYERDSIRDGGEGMGGGLGVRVGRQVA